MNWKIFQQTKPVSIGNTLVAGIYDQSGVLVTSYEYPGVYSGQTQTKTFTGLNPTIVYKYILYESVDHTPAGTVRNNFDFAPQEGAATAREDEYLTAGVTANMTPGGTTYVNLSYAGWDYDVERVSQDTMFPDDGFNPDPDYAQDAAGGWHLIKAGDLFNLYEKFVVRFQPKITPVTPATSFVTSSLLIINDITLDNTFVGKAGLIQGATDKLTITLPSLSSVQNFQLLYFYSAGGNHINAIIKAAGADVYNSTLFKTAGLTGQIILGQNEQLKIYKADGKWQIEFVSPSVYQVGEVIYSYSKLEHNTIFADGNLLNRSVYSRLWAHIQTLEAGLLITEGLWGNTGVQDGITYYVGKGFYSTGDTTTNFRRPLLYQYGFIRGVQGSPGRLVGSLQVDAIINHDHAMDTGESYNGAVGVDGPNRVGHGHNNLMEGHTSEPRRRSDGVTMDRIDTECRPANTGVYALIRI